MLEIQSKIRATSDFFFLFEFWLLSQNSEHKGRIQNSEEKSPTSETEVRILRLNSEFWD